MTDPLSPAGVAFAELPDGTAALLHPVDLSFHELNPTGARIWTLAAELRSTDEIVSMLAVEWDAVEAEVRVAVTDFLEELRAAGFPVPE